MTLPVEGTVSARFHQPRPLAAEVKTHVHGAWDIAAPIGKPIYAPEAGTVYFCCFLRNQGSSTPITELTKKMNMPFDFDGHYYWADIYGSTIVLVCKNHTHIITHSYQNQLQNRGLGAQVAWSYTEEDQDSRFPARAIHTFDSQMPVLEGEKIGYVGNAGFSTGPHIHWEIHHGKKWNSWEARLDPATVFTEE